MATPTKSSPKKSQSAPQSPKLAPQSTIQRPLISPNSPQFPTPKPWWQRWFLTTKTQNSQQLERVKASIMAELSQRGQPAFKSQLFQSHNQHPLLGVRLPTPTPKTTTFGGWGWALLAATVLFGVWLGLPSNTPPVAPATPPPSSVAAPQVIANPTISTPTCCAGTLLLTDTRRILGADSRLRWTLSLTNPTASNISANTLWQFVVQDAVGQRLAATTFVLPQALPAGGATVHTLVMPLKDTVVGRAVAALPLMAFTYAVQPLN
jgi:hypothetical protein